ncbi:response regulator [Mucilaginibacter sp. BJC16-A38]|uniref:response regulator n=1 Tax=Mucilaginibacter phenanthrenivorans TaxID=1234842 RepID=UPI002157D987|nr:response regulator [Mucilaginibacter phenanthrenivorans]MCR8557981.1 response regulator [Mucilaginibacter phenanthrenivorans]
MCKLFVLEDNPIDQYILKSNLDKYEAFEEITYYSNGKPLINYLDANRDNPVRLPDMMFVDLEMPEVNGWHVLEKLNALSNSSCKEIIVYVISTSIALNDILRANAYSFVKEFISKPVTNKNYRAISAEADLICEEN